MLRAKAEQERRRRQRVALYAADPAALAQAAGFVPDPWQAQVLASRAQALLILCARQTGKSTVVALLVAREMLRTDAMVVIVSPSERQSKELMRKVLTFWRKVGRPVPHVSATKTSLELANGARIEAFPASSDTVRGLSAVTLMVCDEAAVVPDELYSSLSPMLAVSGGRLIGLSTPKGRRGWFYGLWATAEADDPDIARVTVKAADCPRISPAWLARERRRIGAWWSAQEYDVEWIDAQSSAFRSEDVERAFDASMIYDAELFA